MKRKRTKNTFDLLKQAPPDKKCPHCRQRFSSTTRQQLGLHIKIFHKDHKQPLVSTKKQSKKGIIFQTLRDSFPKEKKQERNEGVPKNLLGPTTDESDTKYVWFYNLKKFLWERERNG